MGQCIAGNSCTIWRSRVVLRIAVPVRVWPPHWFAPHRLASWSSTRNLATLAYYVLILRFSRLIHVVLTCMRACMHTHSTSHSHKQKEARTLQEHNGSATTLGWSLEIEIFTKVTFSVSAGDNAVAPVWNPAFSGKAGPCHILTSAKTYFWTSTHCAGCCG